jgi:hypothetical protein
MLRERGDRKKLGQYGDKKQRGNVENGFHEEAVHNIPVLVA